MLVRCDSCGELVPDYEAEYQGTRVGPDLIEYEVWECADCAGVDDIDDMEII